MDNSITTTDRELSKKQKKFARMNAAYRMLEIERFTTELGVSIEMGKMVQLAVELAGLAADYNGCISVGGSSVKDWIRLRLAKDGILSAGGRCLDDSWHVVGLFHFWPWDESRYGPQPTEDCSQPVDTMRSPLHRIADADPIDRTASRISGKDVRKKLTEDFQQFT